MPNWTETEEALPNFVTEFITALAKIGIIPLDPIETDGEIHRLRIKGVKPEPKNGWCWYILRPLDHQPMKGILGHWKSGQCHTWIFDGKHLVPAADWNIHLETNSYSNMKRTPGNEFSAESPRSLQEDLPPDNPFSDCPSPNFSSHDDAPPEDKRNDAITRLAETLFFRSFSAETVIVLCTAWNKSYCNPPFTPDAVSRIVAGVALKKHQKKKAEGGVDAEWEIADDGKIVIEDLEAKYIQTLAKGGIEAFAECAEDPAQYQEDDDASAQVSDDNKQERGESVVWWMRVILRNSELRTLAAECIVALLQERTEKASRPPREEELPPF